MRLRAYSQSGRCGCCAVRCTAGLSQDATAKVTLHQGACARASTFLHALPRPTASPEVERLRCLALQQLCAPLARVLIELVRRLSLVVAVALLSLAVRQHHVGRLALELRAATQRDAASAGFRPSPVAADSRGTAQTHPLARLVHFELEHPDVLAQLARHVAGKVARLPRRAALRAASERVEMDQNVGSRRPCRRASPCSPGSLLVPASVARAASQSACSRAAASAPAGRAPSSRRAATAPLPATGCSRLSVRRSSTVSVVERSTMLAPNRCWPGRLDPCGIHDGSGSCVRPCCAARTTPRAWDERRPSARPRATEPGGAG
eukprot:4707884-Prymnesium_polylepis.1